MTAIENSAMYSDPISIQNKRDFAQHINSITCGRMPKKTKNKARKENVH